MSKLSERALLAALHVGVWGGTVHDREVTEDVSLQHKADSDAGRYSKNIIPKAALRAVRSKAALCRQAHNLLTLPWDDDGTRILSTQGHANYVKIMHAHRIGLEASAEEFIKNFADHKEEARKKLGTMYREGDYPEPAEVRKKFYVDVELRAVPEAGDFRAQLSDAAVKGIVKDIERRTEQRLQNAVNDVFSRVIQCVGKMAERLRAYNPQEGATFRDSLVYNIKEMADLIPSLNITGDARLDDLSRQLEEKLVAFSPEILRVDDRARNKTAEEAERILRKVKSFMA